MLIGIYLGAYKALHSDYNIVYQYINSSDRQGGYNVYIVIEKWLKTIHKKGYIQI